MVTITINIRNEVNEAFRNAVKEKLGQGKGTLGKAIEEALTQWLEEKEQRQIAQRQKSLMRKGLYRLGKEWRFDREEIYERR